MVVATWPYEEHGLTPKILFAKRKEMPQSDVGEIEYILTGWGIS